MFDKLFEAQKKADEIKKRLNDVSVSADINNRGITVIASANKEVKEISFDADFLEAASKEELEELLVVVVNKVLAQADTVGQAEMQAATKDLLGGLNM